MLTGSCKTPQSQISIESHKETFLYVDGWKRKFFYYIPEEIDLEKIPLVIVLHGSGGDGKTMAITTGMSNYAKKMGFAVVYPTGFGNRWNDGRNLDTPTDKERIRDLLFLTRLISYFSIRYNIDKEKIFLVGFSNGGFLTTRAACETKGIFRAYAIVGAGISLNLKSLCNNPDPKPFLFIWGMMDELVPFQGGEIFLATRDGRKSLGITASYAETLAFFQRKLNCRNEEIHELSQRSLPSHQGEILHTYYSSCDQGSFVEGYAVRNGKHIWFGGQKTEGDSSLNATDTILRFFFQEIVTTSLEKGVFISEF